MPVYITLSFRRESNSVLLNRLFSKRITQKKSLSEKKEDLCFTQNTKSMKMFASHRTVFTNLNVYGQTYTGRSDLDFQIRVSEYVPKWLQKVLKSNDQIGVDDKYPSSSIAKLTVEIGYMIDRNSVYTRV